METASGTYVPMDDDYYYDYNASWFSGNMSGHHNHYLTAIHAYENIILVILLVGLAGNSLSLFVFLKTFCRPMRNKSAPSLERPAYAGLLSLAVSDLLFCLVNLILYVPQEIFSEKNRADFYKVKCLYIESLRGTFIFSSTWITVVTSAERFFAVWQPIRARRCLKARNSFISCAVITIVSVSFNCPMLFSKFLTKVVTTAKSSNYTPTTLKANDDNFKTSTESYLFNFVLVHGDLMVNDCFDIIYYVFLGIFDTIIPFIVLATCNIGLAVILLQKRNGKWMPTSSSTKFRPSTPTMFTSLTGSRTSLVSDFSCRTSHIRSLSDPNVAANVQSKMSKYFPSQQNKTKLEDPAKRHQTQKQRTPLSCYRNNQRTKYTDCTKISVMVFVMVTSFLVFVLPSLVIKWLDMFLKFSSKENHLYELELKHELKREHAQERNTNLNMNDNGT
ncbi:hypothetical protein HELRODRAFT_160196 [Helobdella robusta]|uniref:G-protein coupled receptors family 1 profile domain-containing protein n=1 Tax=Helobdella robusta TaxID=6412 RepID=T1EPY3_HELRO|nr:hypothetical protein HELRODRAFT_160196 [Helobdella robusta]ESO06066.1 hypothetical protein HELRODRAFT_160196 [Helobdella robusta]